MEIFYSLFNKSGNTFQGQEPDEQIILFLRRHPFVIFSRVFGIVLGYLIPTIASLYFIDPILSNGLLVPYLFILSIFTSIVWASIFYSLTMYTLDVWIITDRRIIDSNQHGFFNRSVSELHFSRIQDILVKTDGPFQTVINYGDLYLQTAGTEERFIFYQIPDPIKVKDIIMDIAFPEDSKARDGTSAVTKLVS